MDPEFIESSPTYWVRALALFALAALCSVAIDLYWPKLMQFVKALPLCDQIPWWRSIVIGLASPFILASGLLASAGWKVLRFRQWPLPGTLVWRRTKIKRGPRVLLHAYMSFAVAGAIVAGLAFLAHLAWPIVRPVFTTWPGCNGA